MPRDFRLPTPAGADWPSAWKRHIEAVLSSQQPLDRIRLEKYPKPTVDYLIAFILDWNAPGYSYAGEWWPFSSSPVIPPANHLELSQPFFGTPAAGDDFIFYTFVAQQCRLPADCVGSQETIKVGATAPAVFSLRKNGVEFGTATVTGTSVVYDNPATLFEDDDYFEFICPDPADSTLANFNFTFLLTILGPF